MTEVAEKQHLIAPHGGYLVDRTGQRPDNVDSLEQITLTSRELSDLDMLASGALSPLEGFIGRDDYERVLGEMRLAKGVPWALPVCLAVDHEPQGDEVALTDEAGKPFATLEVEEVYEYDKEREARNAFRTTDEAHPGVARLYAQKPLYLAGKVTVPSRRSRSSRSIRPRRAPRSPSAGGSASSVSRPATRSTVPTST
jgi:sulfate adenylyltransferase